MYNESNLINSQSNLMDNQSNLMYNQSNLMYSQADLIHSQSNLMYVQSNLCIVPFHPLFQLTFYCFLNPFVFIPSCLMYVSFYQSPFCLVLRVPLFHSLTFHPFLNLRISYFFGSCCTILILSTPFCLVSLYYCGIILFQATNHILFKTSYITFLSNVS